jgi:hypothetical protein
MTDTTTMTGAEFRRHVGTDPERWAEAFLSVYHDSEFIRTPADRQASVAKWFRDFADACVAEAVRHETAAICSPTRSE